MAPTTRDLPESRLHYLDNIRSVVIVFVVLFHAILPYSLACPWWYVVDPQPIRQAIFFMLFLEPILMPVLFFISGLLVWPSYGRQGAARFMAGKVKRLLVPFLLCTFLFSPIMPFIRQCLRAAISDAEPLGFWAFWLTFLRSGAEIHAGLPNRADDLVVNQYWFLGLLFIFLSGFCVYRLLGGGRTAEQQRPGMVTPPARPILLLLIVGFGLTTGLIYGAACLLLDGNVWITVGSLFQLQPSKAPIYLSFFLAGIFVERRNWLPRLVGLWPPLVWLAAGTLTTVAYFTVVLTTFPVEHPSPTLVWVSRILRLFLVITVTLWSLSFFSRRLNRSTLLWRELSSNSYNIYLIHMVPQVVLQLLALSWPVPAALKFTGVSLVTVLVSYLVSRFLVRKTAAGTIVGLVLLFVTLCLVLR